MQTTNSTPSTNESPMEHTGRVQRKAATGGEVTGPAITQVAAGEWHIIDFATARAVLRNPHVKQAGFRAEIIDTLPTGFRLPILYQEGAPHHEQRRASARYFTPKTVSQEYRQMMEKLADQTLATLQQTKSADLSDLSMSLAVQVAAEVIGLTNSKRPGLAHRINAFFEGEPQQPFSWRPRALLDFLRRQSQTLAFFRIDVRPAIRVRKQSPRDDVISYLLAQKYSDFEILTECVTYAAAGMATTREFIAVAAWHFIDQPALRARYLIAEEAERYQILHEILRLEPVVEHLYRRTTDDVALTTADGTITIPKGERIDVDIAAINTHPGIVGPEPLAVCPARPLNAERIGDMVLSFGDGHHRCVGEHVAIQESDIFLRKLLAIASLRIEQLPTKGFSDIAAGYTLRHFLVTVA